MAQQQVPDPCTPPGLCVTKLKRVLYFSEVYYTVQYTPVAILPSIAQHQAPKPLWSIHKINPGCLSPDMFHMILS